MNSLGDASMVNVNPRTGLTGWIINMRIPFTSLYTVFLKQAFGEFENPKKLQLWNLR